MSEASHSAENRQKLLWKDIQGILKSLPAEYSATRCSFSTTHGRICDACMQREAVDAKLFAHLEEVNKQFRIQAEIKERVNLQHDPLTRHLPVEIISQIFSVCTKNVNSLFKPQSPRVQQGPLLLAAVSKSWRRIAFDTPHLWKTVNIHILNDNLPMKVELTKEWLDRSRQLPLQLSLVYDLDWDKIDDLEHLIPLFNVVQNVAPRWCTLVLRFSATLYPAFLGEVTSAPTLESLTLFDDSDSQGDFRLPYTPLLKHLDVRADVFFSCLSIEWGRLTTIQADAVTMGEFFDVLRRVEGLDSFRFDQLVADPEYTLPTTPFTHSALRELYLETNVRIDPSDVATMLNLVVFPSLKIFGYKSGSRTSFPNSALPAIFNHCRLTYFELSGNLSGGTTDDLISILSELPTLTDFNLKATENKSALMTDKLLQKLTPIPRDEFNYPDRLLPRLESLEFVGCKKFSWSCLASFVNANISDGGSPDLPLTPERPECINSLRSIYFKVYVPIGIDRQTLTPFERAHGAGIFHCQVERANRGCNVIYSFSRRQGLS